MKKKDWIEKILELLVITTLILMLGTIFIQVFARMFLPQAPSWTEEAARFFFIYSIVFGAPIALKRGEYVRVDILINLFSERVKDLLDAVIYLILTIFFGIVGYNAYIFGSLGFNQTSPAMGLPMFIPYMSIAIGSFFLIIYGIYKVIQRAKGEGRSDLLKEVLEYEEVEN